MSDALRDSVVDNATLHTGTFCGVSLDVPRIKEGQMHSLLVLLEAGIERRGICLAAIADGLFDLVASVSRQ